MMQPYRPVVAVTAKVEGLVQGVGFRYAARRAAARLGIVGWVRNLPDGSVEIWAQGSQDAVDHLLAFLRNGPPGALVRSVAVVPVEPDPFLNEFQITF